MIHLFLLFVLGQAAFVCGSFRSTSRSPLEGRVCKAYLERHAARTKTQKSMSRDFRANCAHASIFPYALCCA